MKAIGIVFTTMWKHEVLKQAQVPARDQASARRQSRLGLEVGSIIWSGEELFISYPSNYCLGNYCKQGVFLYAGTLEQNLSVRYNFTRWIIPLS